MLSQGDVDARKPPKTGDDPEAVAHRALALDIGANLRQARVEQNLRLGDLAAKSGVSADRLILLETGQDRVTPGELWKFSQILQQPISYFFSYSQEAPWNVALTADAAA